MPLLPPAKGIAVDGSETPIQSSRLPERSAPQGAFQGTVTGLRREGEAQTVEIQTAQGRLRVQAEGDFQVGERIRVFLPQGGAIRLEKAQMPAGPVQDWGAGYQMPGNLSTLKNVRTFEEQLADWASRRQPGPAAGAGGGLAQALGAETEALLRLPLPELLKRVLAREGGREMLMQALAAMSPEGFSSLLDGLEKGGRDPAKAPLLAMLRTLRRDFESAGGAPGVPGSAAGFPGGGSPAPRASGAREMGAFWPGGSGGPGEPGGPRSASDSGPEPGADGAPGASVTDGKAATRGAAMGLMPWMGRVLERQDTGGALAFAGGTPLPPSARGPVDPMFRYLLDLGGRTLEVQSGQSREPGEFVDFEMEPPGARLQARFLDPAQSLPPGLRSEFSRETPEMRAALQVAARSLADFRQETFFPDLVRDFGQVLAQTGRFAIPNAEGTTPLPPGQLPGPREIEGLLRLFVAFPRDGEQPERQARAWSEAVRDPKALADLFRALRPETETSLLRAGTALRLAAGAAPPDPAPASPAAPGLMGPGEAKEDALVSLLRRMLPEGFKSPELLDLARAPAADADGKEAKAAHFALQAFAGLVPREDEIREGRPNTFYFYHNQDWKGLQITWERKSDPESRRRRDPETPLKVRVQTDARHMGKVDVDLTVKGDEAFLRFRNQYHDVKEILDECMPELRKSAGLLGVHIDAWTYAPLEDFPPMPPAAGWVRPAWLLDLMG